MYIYLLDLGINGLLFLKKLLYVVDMIMVDEEIKIGKFICCLILELKECK